MNRGDAQASSAGPHRGQEGHLAPAPEDVRVREAELAEPADLDLRRDEAVRRVLVLRSEAQGGEELGVPGGGGRRDVLEVGRARRRAEREEALG